MVSDWLESQRINWPEGYDYELGGELKATDDSYGDMGNAFVLAILMIFILLALIFHSLGQPIIILLVVPLALTGTFIGYFLAYSDSGWYPLCLACLRRLFSLWLWFLRFTCFLRRNIPRLWLINRFEKKGLSVMLNPFPERWSWY